VGIICVGHIGKTAREAPGGAAVEGDLFYHLANDCFRARTPAL